MQKCLPIQRVSQNEWKVFHIWVQWKVEVQSARL